MKKKNRFFKSLRFRILIILVILGIVPSVIVTRMMIGNYEKQAVAVRAGAVSNQCSILCNQIIKENYLNDPSSEAVNGKLEMLSNVYGGRILIVDRDFKIVKDTYHVDEGKTLVSPKIIRNFKKGEPTDYQRKGQVIEFAVPVRSADVPQIQGAMLMTISCSEITATMMELNYQGLLLMLVMVVLSVLLGYILSFFLLFLDLNTGCDCFQISLSLFVRNQHDDGKDSSLILLKVQ